MRATTFGLFCLAAATASVGFVGNAAAAETTNDPWPGIAREAFNGRPLADGSGILTIEMPYRAEDAAIVPVSVRAKLPAGDTRHVKAITIVVDENPAPVAATFTIGEGSGVTSISTRVRVNSYTNVHAVAELSDNALYVVKTYVKASGGCSAPASKNAEEAKADIGRMRFRQFAKALAADGQPKASEGPASRLQEAQIMIRHPNNSGLQMDQVSRLYIPAFFIRELKVWQGDQLVMAMEGGISISEDPNIRFNYLPNGAKTFRIEARDTENHVFASELPAQPQM
jgi:sulfur-oxidizing protein SoxY